MRDSLNAGFSFGLTSGIITTLGLMVGLYAGTNSKVAVIGGVLTIAIADAFSDSLGIHISQESQGKRSKAQVWESTLATFFSKLFFASTFVAPVLLFQLKQAVSVSIIWGMLLLAILSYSIARKREEKSSRVIFEHLIIAWLVIIITRFVGSWIASIFS
ncbi:MAG TPA: hypothetical protein VMW41_06495 [Candidatus Bathyarchaeia archaeon]|nr:hypothetical protein [Candidatus Bathyarchaeia archaeon]